MITLSGEGVWPPGSPEVAEFGERAPSLYAIGVGLGRTARWRGQTETPFSVLAHTIVVANLLPPELRIHGLLHDAAEAIVGDVPATWKTPADSERERVILERIYAEVDVPWPTALEHSQVKVADMDARYAEAHVLGFRDADRWFTLPDEGSLERRGVDRAAIGVHRQLGWHEAYQQASTAGARFAAAVGVWRSVARGEVPAGIAGEV